MASIYLLEINGFRDILEMELTNGTKLDSQNNGIAKWKEIGIELDSWKQWNCKMELNWIPPNHGIA